MVVVVTYGCSGNDFVDLLRDLNDDELVKFKYVIKTNELYCDPVQGQKQLKEWSRHLREGEIASYPNADNYLILEFRNGHNYKARVFPSMNNLDYSVLYMNGVYIGEPLVLDAACTVQEAHNKSPQSDGYAAAGLKR